MSEPRNADEIAKAVGMVIGIVYAKLPYATEGDLKAMEIVKRAANAMPDLLAACETTMEAIAKARAILAAEAIAAGNQKVPEPLRIIGDDLLRPAHVRIADAIAKAKAKGK